MWAVYVGCMGNTRNSGRISIGAEEIDPQFA
jgi:hypothetical protein